MKSPSDSKITAGLSFQFGLLMAVILIISMIITTWLSYRDNTQINERTLNTRIEAIGDLLAAISIEPLLVYDFVSLSEYMQSTVNKKDIVFTQLLGKDNKPITQHFSRDSQLVNEILQTAATDNVPDIFEKLSTHPDIISKQFPVMLEGKKIGVVSLGLDRRDYDRAAAKHFQDNIILTILISLFAGLSIYLIFNHRILKPINRFKKAASHIANFELDKKIPIQGHNELSDLASSFNDMTEHLAAAVYVRDKTMEELRHFNETLEERIHERTQELQLLNRKVTHQAMHDPLTGLPNRTLIMERLRQSIQYAHRHNKTLAVFMLDLNRFKEVNDTLGHPVGDQVLIGVAQRLPEVLRETDTVGRLGGDEFVVILSETTPEHAIQVAEKIQQAFAPDFEINGHLLSVGTSIGIALYPDHTQDPDTLVQKADIALYVAKKKHDHYIAVYDESKDHHSLSRLLMVSDLKEAIEKDQLTLHFQPQVDLVTGKVCGLEALCRWQHPEQGYIAPDTFIPMAEDSGLIKALTDCVLKCAIEQLSKWIKSGLHQRVALNLSIGNLLDKELPRRFAELLQIYDVPAELLKLEITESMIMSDPDRVIETLSDPVFEKVNVAIDDFGTGYSSLNYLKRLPVNEIKIDKSFVYDMYENTEDASIVNSIIQLAKSLGLKIVAEGVENQETVAQLSSLDCDIAQGYFYSKPVPPEQIIEVINNIETPLLRQAR